MGIAEYKDYLGSNPPIRPGSRCRWKQGTHPLPLPVTKVPQDVLIESSICHIYSPFFEAGPRAIS